MKKFLAIILIVVTAAILWELREPIVNTMTWFGNRETVTTSMERAGIWGPGVLFILFVLQVFLAFIPGQALMVASGYLYGFWGGFLLSWLSLVAGGEAAYVLARRYGRPFAEKWISPGVLERWNQAAMGQGIVFFAISLVMPLVPNDAMCYVAGLGRISHGRFSIANFLGRGIACLFTSAVGAFGGDIPGQVWAVMVAIVIAGGIAWLIVRNRKSCIFIG